MGVCVIGDNRIPVLSSSGAGAYDATSAYTFATWIRGVGLTDRYGHLFRRWKASYVSENSYTDGVEIGAYADTVSEPRGFQVSHFGSSTVGREIPIDQAYRLRLPGVGPSGEWWHLGVTWSTADNVTRVYVNGRLTHATGMSVAPTAGGNRVTQIGSQQGVGTMPLMLSSVQWWHDTCLTDAELAAVVRGQVPLRPSGWWAVGTDAENGVDRSGNDHHLTYSGVDGRGSIADPGWVTSATLAARLT